MVKELREEVLHQSNRLFRIKPVQQMAAACTGALVTSVIMTPLDVVKIRIQAQQKMTNGNKGFVYCNGLMDHICPYNPPWAQGPVKFNGTWDAFVKISRTEGVLSLWSGLSPTLVLAIPATVVYFVTYEQLRARLNDWFGSPGVQPLWVPLVSGCVARLWAATTVSPLELVRTKMQSKKLSYVEVHQALHSLVKYSGYTGLWKGVGATLCRDVPFSGLYWVTYEYLKTKSPDPEVSFLFSFLAGSCSGTLAAVVTTPFDVVKTHQQIELADEIFTEPPKRHSNATFGMIRTIYLESGLRGCFVGVIPRVIKVAPACAIMVSTFEYGKNFFQCYNLMQYRRKIESYNYTA